MTDRFLALILCLLTLVPTSLALGQEDAALELARRLMGPWGDPGMRAVVTPAGLPADLPVDVPLPDDFVVVGSFANYEVDGSFMHGQIVLDSPFDSQATQRQLDDVFASARWTVQEQAQTQGFQPANPHISSTYCAPDGKGHVYMNAFPLGEGKTDVRLEVSGDVHYNPCEEIQAGMEMPSVPLPTLIAPAGSETTLHGGNWLEDQASSTAVLGTELPADELLRHFEEQLEQAGWSRQEDSQGRSSWLKEHQSREWRGLLDIEELGASRYYVSYLAITP